MQKTDNRREVFDQVRNLLKKYEPPFSARISSDSRYELWSEKEIEIAGRKRKEIFFASVVIQTGYVGLYYMPVYVESDLRKIFGKELLGRLKGKSCFHLTRLDRTLLGQIRQALAAGFRLYRKNRWV